MSEQINHGGSAFPVTYDGYSPSDGMTLRDYFAAKAMQAYLSGEDRDNFRLSEWATCSYEAADAMLKARSA